MRPRWHRQLIAVLAACFLLAAMPAVAQGKNKKKPKRTERTVTLDYDGTQHLGWVTPAGQGGHRAFAEYAIQPNKGERYLSLQTSDATGLPTFLTVSYFGAWGSFAEVCGSTDEAIRIAPRMAIYLWIWHGTCSDGTPAPGTTGTITATLSNLP